MNARLETAAAARTRSAIAATVAVALGATWLGLRTPSGE